MSKRYTPFSNATDASWWLDNNCYKCNVKQCYAKKVIEMGFITGYITQRVIDVVGTTYLNMEDHYCTLNKKCNGFNISVAKKVKPDNLPNLFAK